MNPISVTEKIQSDFQSPSACPDAATTEAEPEPDAEDPARGAIVASEPGSGSGPNLNATFHPRADTGHKALCLVSRHG